MNAFKDVPEAQKQRLKALEQAYASDFDDLVAKWEVFAIKNEGVLPSNDADLDKFQAQLDRQKADESRKRRNLNQPLVQNKHQKFSPNVQEPAKVGKVLFGQGSAYPQFSLAKTVQLSDNSMPKPFNIQVNAVASLLDEQIEQYTDRLLKHLKIDKRQVANPSQALQTPSVVVGRVCRDSVGKLDEQKASWQAAPEQLALEPSKGVAAGMRVQLDTSKLAKSFIEGELVAFRGLNPDGQCFIANEQIVPPPPLPTALSADTVTKFVVCFNPTLRELEKLVALPVSHVFVLAGGNEMSPPLTANNCEIKVISGPDDVLNFDCAVPTAGRPNNTASHSPYQLSFNELALAFVNCNLPQTHSLKLASIAELITNQQNLIPGYPLRNANLDPMRLKYLRPKTPPHLIALPSTQTEVIEINGTVFIGLGNSPVLVSHTKSTGFQVDLIM